MPQTLQYIVGNIGGSAKPRTDMLEGEEHFVVPAATLAEGVWEGDKGALYYPGEEFPKSVSLWDHKPAIVYHPGGDGYACKPSILNSRKTGILLGTVYDDKLRHDVWLNKRRLNEVDNRITSMLNEGKPIEVSTGLRVDVEMKEGEWNGKKYVGICHNFQPDHLAILPDKVGAYSTASGGGLMVVNASVEPESIQRILRRSIEEQAHFLKLQMVGNELSFTDISRQLSDLLSSRFGEKGKYWDGYVQEVFSDYVVYCDTGRKMYAIGYTVSDNTVELTGDPVEVTRAVVYTGDDGKTYTSNEDRRFTLNEEPSMAFDRKKHRENLAKGGYSEDQLKGLDKLDDTQFQLIQPTVVQNQKIEVVAPDGYDKVEKDGKVTFVKKEEKKETVQNDKKESTVDEYVRNAPPEIREIINDALDSRGQERAQLITVITQNKRNTIPAEVLSDPKKFDMPTLRGMARLAREPREEYDDLLGDGIEDLVPRGLARRIPAVVGNEGGGNGDVPQPLKLPKMNEGRKPGRARRRNKQDDDDDEE